MPNAAMQLHVAKIGKVAPKVGDLGDPDKWIWVIWVTGRPMPMLPVDPASSAQSALS